MNDAARPAELSLWRKAWRFPLVAMMAALLALAAGLALVAGIAFAGVIGLPPEVRDAVLGILVAAVSVVVAKLVISRLGERRRDDLPGKDAIPLFVRGLVGAFLLMSVIVGLVWLVGGYTIAGWGGATSWPMLLFVAGLQAAFFEEVLCRGILFRFLEEFGGSWFALALSSAAFGLAHIFNENATWFGAIAIAIEAGVLLGGAYMVTRSLWLPIGLHFGWNVTQGLLWDVPVSGSPVDGVFDARPAGDVLISGGAFGVEASIFAIVVAGAAGAWLVYRAIKDDQVVRPLWVRRRLARETAISPASGSSPARTSP